MSKQHHSKASHDVSMPAPHPARSHRPSARQQARRTRQRNTILKVAAIAVAIVAILAWIYVANSQGQAAGTAAQYAYQVAVPGPGALAPDFTLPATNGQAIHLGAYRGRSVLLYFQEGIGCESCWTQMVDMQTQMGRFQALGIATMLTITTNPLDALRQKVADEGIRLPVLADPSFSVSNAYNATAYGMMSGAADGHTFILVGPDGRIRWRGDFGGPPNYTMYVPIPTLLTDLQGVTNGK